MIYPSVVFQFLAFVCVGAAVTACFVELPENLSLWIAVGAPVGGAVACQFVAACYFMVFLQSVARHVERYDLESLAGKVVALLAFLFPSFVGLAILAMIVLGVAFLLGCCGFFVVLGGAIVWVPVASVVMVIALVMYMFYGWVLLQLRSEIVSRLAQKTPFHDMD